MLFTQNLHADGWWDHMPAGHRVDVVMNPAALPSSLDRSAGLHTGQTVRTVPRRIKRSHASAWILVAAVGATGGALAVATIRDPQSMRQHLDSTLAEVKSMTGSSPSSAATTAQATAPEATPAPTPEATPEATPVAPPVQEPAAVTATKSDAAAQSRSTEAPLPYIAPAAGPRVSKTLQDAPVKQLAAPAESVSKEMPEAPQVTAPSPLPPTPLAPLQAPPVVETLTPVQAPPVVVTPPAAKPADEVAPPPVQAPASSVQQ